MNYRIRIHAPEGVSDAERQEAERRFEAAFSLLPLGI